MYEQTVALKPATVVVLEGLDATGKSTQFNLLRSRLGSGEVAFAHMPSGLSPFTRKMYEVLESRSTRPKSGLAKQLAHLACHADSLAYMRANSTQSSLVLDRWWWSTVAYGLYGGSVVEEGLSESGLQEVIDAIWSETRPSVVFLFLETVDTMYPANPDVERGYLDLAEASPFHVVVVPRGEPESTNDFILETLAELDLLDKIPSDTRSRR